MKDIIKKNIESIHLLCEKFGVETMHLFGSAVSDDFNEESDFDILISFKEMSFESYADNFFALHTSLEKLLGRKVDLVTEKSLSNPYFIQSIENSKHLLYAA